MKFIEIDQSEHGPERKVSIVINKICSISYLKGENLIHIQICTPQVAYEVAFNLEEEMRAQEYYKQLQLKLNEIEVS